MHVQLCHSGRTVAFYSSSGHGVTVDPIEAPRQVLGPYGGAYAPTGFFRDIAHQCMRTTSLRGFVWGLVTFPRLTCGNVSSSHRNLGHEHRANVSLRPRCVWSEVAAMGHSGPRAESSSADNTTLPGWMKSFKSWTRGYRDTSLIRNSPHP